MNRSVVLRGVVFAVAIGLGAVAVWLIVTSTTQKRIELGVLAGLWGLLLGTFSMIGTRRVVQTPAPAESAVGAELELRSAMALERSADAQARREYEARLEQLLREEVRATMGRELAEMRAEIAQLRGELLEKVGGQLRLERIETTRLIGSDLEALQDEVRKLKFAKPAAGIESDIVPAVASLHRIVEHRPPVVAEPVMAEPVAAEPVEHVFVASTAGAAPTVEAVPVDVVPVDVVPVETAAEQTAPIRPRASAPEPEPVEVAEPEAVVVAEPEPVVVAEPEPAAAEPEPVAQRAPVAAQAAAGTSMFDDLSSLPRLRPFSDVEPDPVDEPVQYHGRRRRDENTDRENADHPADGRHSAAGARRHRRADERDSDQDDVLARLLARESVR